MFATVRSQRVSSGGKGHDHVQKTIRFRGYHVRYWFDPWEERAWTVEPNSSEERSAVRFGCLTDPSQIPFRKHTVVVKGDPIDPSSGYPIDDLCEGLRVVNGWVTG